MANERERLIASLLASLSKINFKDKGIKLFFTYDEEIGFSGIKELINNKISFPRYMVIGKPTNNEIIYASKGLLKLKITFKGISSHSSKPEEGINSIEKCVDFINKFDIKNLFTGENSKINLKNISKLKDIIN